jgi:hypothetical protein
MARLPAWPGLVVLAACGFHPTPARTDAAPGPIDAPGPGRDVLAATDGPHVDGPPLAIDAAPDAAIEPPRLLDYTAANGPSVTWTGSARAGDIVLVTTYTGTAVPTVTDSHGSTYATLVKVQNSSGTCVVFDARVATPTSADTVTADCGGCGQSTVVAAYTNVSASAPLDGGATVALGNGSAASASVTTSRANDTVVAIAAATAAPAPGPGFTQEGTTMGDTLLEDRVAASPGSYNATVSLPASTYFCMGLVAVHGD